jgi:prophage regulatory protein
MSDSPRAARLLRLDEVLRLVPLKKPTIYRAIRDGRFPRPCKLLGGRASAWDESEITEWIAARLSERGEVQR